MNYRGHAPHHTAALLHDVFSKGQMTAATKSTTQNHAQFQVSLLTHAFVKRSDRVFCRATTHDNHTDPGFDT